MKKKITFIAFLLGALVITGCGKSSSSAPGTYFTVSFDTGEGGTVIAPQSIKNGGLVSKPTNPERTGYAFSGEWTYQSFPWKFNIDIVTSDMTLVAGWLEVSSTPTNIKMTIEPFSSKVTWRQTDATGQNIEVSIRPASGTAFTPLAGHIDIDASSELNTVTFTPTTLPQGGAYYVKVVSGSEVATSEELFFSGAGVAANPYLVNEILDFQAILDNESGNYDKAYYLQVSDLIATLVNPLEINNESKITFSGQYDGNNNTLSFSGNGGLFHEIAASGVVKNLVIDGTTHLYAAEANLYPIGIVADTNKGLIENISSRALIEDNHLQGALEAFGSVKTSDMSTGAGGIVGINKTGGIIRNVTVGGAGAVKAGRGVGGVAAYNQGLIEYATVTATLPAGNQANTAKSSNTYSYAGGIAGFNFGTIQYVSVSGRVFGQSAYAATGDGNETKNVGFGGIAGYNQGLITNASFARSLASKEFIDKSRATELQDAANNLGVASVHGDIYVGGISGINAGEITSSYVGGALIGGRDFIGGISGLTLSGSNIHNTYAFAEVAVKDEGGNKINAANAKTTLTTYNIAADGFDAATTLFKRLVNSETSAVWVPGDRATPKLPEFTALDLTTVGNKFTSGGTLLWQQGAVTGVDIALDSIVLPYGQAATLEYNVYPSSAPDVLTVWTSSNSDVVAVIGEGIIQGIGVGTATVTVTTRDGGFTDTIEVTVEDYIHVNEVNVSAEIDLPQPNNKDDRPEIEIGTTLNFVVEVLPEGADYKGYALVSSNSRAVVTDNQVIFVVGSGAGNVSITIQFEDASFASLEYRFKTIPAVVIPGEVAISEVIVSAGEQVLPKVNDSSARPEIEVGTTFTLSIQILPANATNKNYTVTSSQTGRATVDGLTVSVIGTGSFSIKIQFEDPSVGNAGLLEYRFSGINSEPVELAVNISSQSLIDLGLSLPEANGGAAAKVYLSGTPTFTIMVEVTSGTIDTFKVASSTSRATVSYSLADKLYTVTVDPNESNIGAFTITITINDSAYAYCFDSSTPA